MLTSDDDMAKLVIAANQGWVTLSDEVEHIVRRHRAEAWQEGFKQGGPMHDEHYDDPDAHTRNPYREEES